MLKAGHDQWGGCLSLPAETRHYVVPSLRGPWRAESRVASARRASCWSRTAAHPPRAASVPAACTLAGAGGVWPRRCWQPCSTAGLLLEALVWEYLWLWGLGPFSLIRPPPGSTRHRVLVGPQGLGVLGCRQQGAAAAGPWLLCETGAPGPLAVRAGAPRASGYHGSCSSDSPAAVTVGAAGVALASPPTQGSASRLRGCVVFRP